MANNIIDLGTIDVREPISSDGSRGLTAGEIAMLRPYFGDSMDYSKITINKNWSIASNYDTRHKII
ncbi:MAG: hypothetical protein PHI79_07130 [Sulfurovaceae bacterium]|nr:hypothetical protein [Sulfurovaceae bacterium]MDD5549350.1 hypothetical protein [Sulfurovaceae bacterium]